jgi:tetratricopeptide (TPR) repeat protein
LTVGVAACSHGPRESRGGFHGAPVVLISIDTLRSDHLPAYGYDKVQTPNIDALRHDAILFQRAYSHVPLTLPAHASMLTGLLPFEHGVRDNLGYELDGAKHPTLAALLKAQGYATGAAVSAYVIRGKTGLGGSFDYYEDDIPTPPESDAASQVRRPGGDTAALALKWLETASSKPFFLFLHLYEPHSPYEPPEPYKSRYASAYDATIAAADAIVGKVIGELKRRGLYDRSVVLLVSDHGEGLGDHGEEFHGILLYREALQVPLLLKLPGSRSGGSSVARPVGLIDIVPTLADLLGLKVSPSLRGRSLLDPAPPADGQGRLYAETYYPRIHLGWSHLRSLVDERYHFIDGPGPELYDLREDAAERANLLESRASVAQAMRSALEGIETLFEGPGKVAAEDVERLKALGYLGGGVAPPLEAGGRLPDPKERVHVLQDVKAAFRLSASGKDVEAAEALRRVLAANPALFDAQYELGRVLARLERWDEAAKVFESALAHAPTFEGPVALALARVEIARDRMKEAEGYARRALALNAAQAHEILARVALSRDDLAGAESEAQLARGDVLAELNAAVLRAEIRLRRAQVAEGLALLDETRARIQREKLPALRDLQFLRGDALARLGRLPEARAAFEDETRAFPTNTQAYARLAIVYGLEGRRVSDVRALLEAMFKARPGTTTALLAAQTLESMGDRQTAAAWRARAR